jgi:hypothetical protein
MQAGFATLLRPGTGELRHSMESKGESRKGRSHIY